MAVMVAVAEAPERAVLVDLEGMQLLANGSNPTLTDPAFDIGNPGAGALGGFMGGSGTVRAPSGATGLSGNTN